MPRIAKRALGGIMPALAAMALAGCTASAPPSYTIQSTGTGAAIAGAGRCRSDRASFPTARHAANAARRCDRLHRLVAHLSLLPERRFPNMNRFSMGAYSAELQVAAVRAGWIVWFVAAGFL